MTGYWPAARAGTAEHAHTGRACPVGNAHEDAAGRIVLDAVRYSAAAFNAMWRMVSRTANPAAAAAVAGPGAAGGRTVPAAVSYFNLRQDLSAGTGPRQRRRRSRLLTARRRSTVTACISLLRRLLPNLVTDGFCQARLRVYMNHAVDRSGCLAATGGLDRFRESQILLRRVRGRTLTFPAAYRLSATQCRYRTR